MASLINSGSIIDPASMTTWDGNLGPSATFDAGDVLGVKITYVAAPGDVEGALVLMYKVE